MGFVAIVAGLALGITDLERVGVLLAVLPVPAWFMVRQSRAGLSVSHTVSRTRVEVDDHVEVKLALANPSSIGTGPLRITETVPGGLPLRFSLGGVRGRQRRTVGYPLPALGRGRYRLGPTTIIASDPFGLVLAESVSDDATELIVAPKPQPLATLKLPVAWRDGSASFSHSVGSGGSDDASVREYRYGDDLRKVHWKSTARSGSMMVRQEERPWQGGTLVLLDTRSYAYPITGDAVASEAFEWAVTAAASIATHLVGRRRPVTAITGNGGVAREHGGTILELLADVQTHPDADMTALGAAITTMGREATIFAILSGTDSRSIAQLVAGHRATGSSVALLLDPLSWTQPGSTGPGLPRTGWQEAAEALSSAGWRVVPVRAGDALATLWPLVLGVRASAQ